MNAYKIEWVGNVDGMMCGRETSDGMDRYTVSEAPRGPFATKDDADEALDAYLYTCREHAGTVKAAHQPRVVRSRDRDVVYMICDGNGYALTSGVAERDVARLAQEFANDFGVSVYYSDGTELGEETEVAPA